MLHSRKVTRCTIAPLMTAGFIVHIVKKQFSSYYFNYVNLIFHFVFSSWIITIILIRGQYETLDVIFTFIVAYNM